MKPEESISEISSKFSDILNGLKSLGESFTDEMLVKKILRSLSDKWESKVTAIIEAKDLKKYGFDDLMGSLMTHEMVNSDEELALVTKKFQKMYRKGDQRYRKNMKNFIKGKTENNMENVERLCFVCNRSSHFKASCPKLKRTTKSDKQKKAMVDTWSKSEKSSSCDEDIASEKANLCLMVLENGGSSGQAKFDKKEADTSDNKVSTHKSQYYDELQNAYNDMFEEFTKVSKKYVKLKSKYSKTVVFKTKLNVPHTNFLEKENKMQKDFDQQSERLLKAETKISFLKKKLETSKSLRIILLQQNDDLQKKIDLLVKDLSSFTKGKHNLDMLLGNQRPYGETSGIGFSGFTKPKKLKDHVTKFCRFKNGTSLAKHIWVCLKSKNNHDKWFMDSACSRHMTGDKSKFTSVKLKGRGTISFKVNSTLGFYSLHIMMNHLRSLRPCAKSFIIKKDTIWSQSGVIMGRSLRISVFGEFCNEYEISHNFSAPRIPQQNEAITSSSYIQNRALVRSTLKKTPYELWRNRKPNVSYFRIFEYKCFVHNNNKILLAKLMQNLVKLFSWANLNITNLNLLSRDIAGDDLLADQADQSIEEIQGNDDNLPREWRFHKHHSRENLLTSPSKKMMTRSVLKKMVENVAHMAYDSKIEPKDYEDALKDKNWLLEMQKELNQFEKNEVWLESIRILFAYASYMNFKLQQMDVKSFFLNEHLNEEVYVE
ncbi:uncharacterized protein LOC126682248 [Mercurialis annua]|uniref:uncharacterized protein LOC126682248 n=1 Tax=Mercurialis annua TaxID=3986 RepID=UPI0024AF5B94|nr:uncharacterized protein LOC126682248 [Mercurialis annua]